MGASYQATSQSDFSFLVRCHSRKDLPASLTTTYLVCLQYILTFSDRRTPSESSPSLLEKYPSASKYPSSSSSCSDPYRPSVLLKVLVAPFLYFFLGIFLCKKSACDFLINKCYRKSISLLFNNI